MTTGSRARPAGGRRGGGGGFTRRRRGRNALKSEEIDYKDVQLMRRFVSERGKIVSGGRIGVSAKNQRRLARAIKRAQHLALVPIAPNHTYVTGAIQTDGARRQDAPVSETEAAEETSEQTAEAVSQTEAPTSEQPATDDAPSDDSEAAPPGETSTEASDESGEAETSDESAETPQAEASEASDDQQ